MTVAEYILLLRKLPQEMPVVYSAGNDTFDNATSPKVLRVDWERNGAHEYCGRHAYAAKGEFPACPRKVVVLE